MAFDATYISILNFVHNFLSQIMPEVYLINKCKRVNCEKISTENLLIINERN